MPQTMTVLCVYCQTRLPKSNYHLDPSNALVKKFWGRVPVLHAASYYLFQKNSDVQHILHELKYNERTDVGVYIGLIYGTELCKKNTTFTKADAIIPVPLHPKKLKKRGYNQSDFFAKGLSESLQIPNITDAVCRNTDTVSQTGKSRIDRWDNVNAIFSIEKPDLLQNKHVILVDDVITTGATLEALSNELISKTACAVSILSIASAI